MGNSISFYCGIRPIGRVSCSSFTMELQERTYGLSWFNCLTYTYSDGQEYVGPPGTEGGGPYEPDWDRAVIRATKLLDLAQKCEARAVYDVPFATKLLSLLKQCAESPLREYCRVEIE